LTVGSQWETTSSRTVPQGRRLDIVGAGDLAELVAEPVVGHPGTPRSHDQRDSSVFIERLGSGVHGNESFLAHADDGREHPEGRAERPKALRILG